VLENYAAPGMLIIGTDSHTPNASGIGGALAIGVGGADAVDAMAGLPWEVKAPKVIGVKLTGRLNGWTAPKDVILKVADILTVKGGTGAVVEYFGPGLESVSCTGQATIGNMGAEIGATTSCFPVSDSCIEYLAATNRKEIASLADSFRKNLVADEGAEYDQIIEINLDTLEPHINGPHSPDRGHAVSMFAAAVKEHGWPAELSAGLIGSCTNSSYEDLSRAHMLAQQALDAGLKSKSTLLINPGSEQIRATMERDGFTETFSKLGAGLFSSGCGPCIGQWDRQDVPAGVKNSIVTSFNRNFARRNDGRAETHAFVVSPDIVIALAVAGRIDFNPLTDSIPLPGGGEFRFSPPVGNTLPANGFDQGADTYTPPPSLEGAAKVQLSVNPKSERLSLLEPFAAWDGKDITGVPILVKTVGKLTTDAISAAGPWLRFRGHLPNLAKNTYQGAINAETGLEGVTRNPLTGNDGEKIPEVALAMREAGKNWVILADDNCGEGSSRESAALQPRYLGARAVIARSFARIHATNLVKQGLLALTLADRDDYDRISGYDTIDIVGLSDLAPGKPITVVVHPFDGKPKFEVETSHILNEEMIEWFKHGSCLNYIKANLAKNGGN
jgi:aconitate hydratase